MIPRPTNPPPRSGVLGGMLFMVIERFHRGDWRAVGERFQRMGRQIPEGSGVSYVASWMWADGAGCFQIMEAPSAQALEPWIDRWRDLGDFEIVPVQTSAEFWSNRPVGP